jgi:hypothetical protein
LNNEYPFSVGCFRGTPDYAAALGSETMRQGVPYDKLPNLAGIIVPPDVTSEILKPGVR